MANNIKPYEYRDLSPMPQSEYGMPEMAMMYPVAQQFYCSVVGQAEKASGQKGNLCVSGLTARRDGNGILAEIETLTNNND